MTQLQGRVAVITGAASGFGLEFARLAAEAEIQTMGATTLAMRVNVSRAEEVHALAEATLARFGVRTLLINNAGIGAGGLAWENSPNEWHQVMGVNLHGVVNGVRSFVPHMLEAAKESG